MGVRDETTGDGGCTSISCGGPVEHTLGIEMINSVGNTRRGSVAPNVEISAVECFLQTSPRVSRLAEVKEVVNSGLWNMNTQRTFLNRKFDIAFASGIS